MFKITVEKLTKTPDNGKQYDNWDGIFEQILEDVDVSALAIFLNKKSE